MRIVGFIVNDHEIAGPVRCAAAVSCRRALPKADKQRWEEPLQSARIGKTNKRSSEMKRLLGCTVFALAVTIAMVPANAKGCLKGAVVGGAAGHVAGHHGMLGAAAGCANSQ